MKNKKEISDSIQNFISRTLSPSSEITTSLFGGIGIKTALIIQALKSSREDLSEEKELPNKDQMFLGDAEIKKHRLDIDLIKRLAKNEELLGAVSEYLRKKISSTDMAVRIANAVLEELGYTARSSTVRLLIEVGYSLMLTRFPSLKQKNKG